MPWLRWEESVKQLLSCIKIKEYEFEQRMYTKDPIKENKWN